MLEERVLSKASYVMLALVSSSPGQLHCPLSFTIPQHLLQGLSIG